MSSNNGSGKGGSFKTERNPFQSKKTGTAPKLQSTPGLLTALDAALARGVGVIIGVTRDGGALSITLLDGDDRHRTYCATEAELGEAALAMRDSYSEALFDEVIEPKAPTRKR